MKLKLGFSEASVRVLLDQEAPIKLFSLSLRFLIQNLSFGYLSRFDIFVLLPLLIAGFQPLMAHEWYEQLMLQLV